MSRKENLKDQIRFLTHAVVHKGKKARVWYSKGSYTKESGIPPETISIYARDYGFGKLPQELHAENETDTMTDYFDKDRARISPDNKYYKDVLKALKKAEEHDKKMRDKFNLRKTLKSLPQ